MAPRVRLGELLVEAQIITREQLEEVLALQKRDARRLGTLLIESGVVTETQVTQVLSQQLSIPWVSLYHIDFSRQLLDMVPRELAEKYCLVPIFVRRVRGIGETLYVAMEDPTHEEAKDAIANSTGLPVRAMIAPPSDIKVAITVYYGAGADHASLAEAQSAVIRRGGAAVAVRLPARAPAEPRKTTQAGLQSDQADLAVKPVAPNRPDAPAPAQPKPAATPSAPPAPVAATAREPLPQASPRGEGGGGVARAPGAAPLAKGKAPRMLTLTLLDGTQVHLPSRSGPHAAGGEPGAPGDNVTAQSLITALKALSQGADATEILGDHVRWEALFAALLSVLLKKHLIQDWEFVDEYKKI